MIECNIFTTVHTPIETDTNLICARTLTPRANRTRSGRMGRFILDTRESYRRTEAREERKSCFCNKFLNGVNDINGLGVKFMDD